MKVGQKVRVKTASRLANGLGIPRDARGIVTCKYRLLREIEPAPNRLDVRFSPKLVVWGVPEEAFEPINEGE